MINLNYKRYTWLGKDTSIKCNNDKEHTRLHSLLGMFVFFFVFLFVCKHNHTKSLKLKVLGTFDWQIKSNLSFRFKKIQMSKKSRRRKKKGSNSTSYRLAFVNVVWYFTPIISLSTIINKGLEKKSQNYVQ